MFLLINKMTKVMSELISHGNIFVDLAAKGSIKNGVWSTLRSNLRLTQIDWRKTAVIGRVWLVAWDFHGVRDYISMAPRVRVKHVIKMLKSLPRDPSHMCFMGFREAQESTTRLPVFEAMMAQKIT